VIFDTYERLRRAEKDRLWDAHFNACARRAAVKARAKRNAEAQQGPGMDWLATDEGWH